MIEAVKPQFLLLFLFFCIATVNAQQPFVTDDADTTPKHHFHFEFSNELDLLQRSALPSLRQNTADAELDYGVFDNLEVGVELPLLRIINRPGTVPLTPTGIGDINLSVKYNFLKERRNSRRPSLALAFNIELPTGDTNRQLGSGLADFYGNGVIQKSLTTKTTMRLNGGILFSGNQTTGEIGIKSRGLVFTGGGSLVKQFTVKLALGAELSGAVTKNFQLGKGQLQTQFGGNYFLKKNMSFDFGIVAGKYAASPRVGLQLGLSVDF
jgi:hypothetical protein